MTQTTFEQGQSQVAGLVKRFSRNAAALEHDRELYQRQIEATDREIDKLVYELPQGTDARRNQNRRRRVTLAP